MVIRKYRCPRPAQVSIIQTCLSREILQLLYRYSESYGYVGRGMYVTLRSNYRYWPKYCLTVRQCLEKRRIFCLLTVSSPFGKIITIICHVFYCV